MFETSFLLFLEHLILNIIVPFIPWLLFLWIFYGQKFKWFLIYLLSRFIWVWVVAFSLLNIQFIYFWIWIIEYFIILWILLIIFILKLYIKKQPIKEYIITLKLKNIYPEIKNSFINLPLVEKIFTIVLSLFSVYFICISGIFNFNLPTYAVDSFYHRNNAAYNIYFDWWIKFFGDKDDILWRWTLWYPVHIPAYRALLSKFTGWINDIYFNSWQRLVFLFWLMFIFLVTFDNTKNIYKSILPVWLICSLPLVFFHSFEWYMDLPSIMYCIISVRLFYQYLETNDFDNLSLWFLVWFILSYTKNDWFVVYFPWLLVSLFIVLCLQKRLKLTINWFSNDRFNLWKSILFFIYFFLPYLIIKIINWLWFNPSEITTLWLWLSETIHREIFSIFDEIFLNMDNYNLVLIMMLFVFISSLSKKGKFDNSRIFVYVWVLIFLILIAVFLFTENYKWLLNQTTVNRSFTMVFVILLWFLWFLLNE